MSSGRDLRYTFDFLDSSSKQERRQPRRSVPTRPRGTPSPDDSEQPRASKKRDTGETKEADIPQRLPTDRNRRKQDSKKREEELTGNSAQDRAAQREREAKRTGVGLYGTREALRKDYITFEGQPRLPCGCERECIDRQCKPLPLKYMFQGKQKGPSK